jgi:hypothetical protein
MTEAQKLEFEAIQLAVENARFGKRAETARALYDTFLYKTLYSNEQIERLLSVEEELTN